MLNFVLSPGDKYDGRCAEIYITEKHFLIYHCSVCEEIYPTFSELFTHIGKDHYENTKEYSKVETKSGETVITQENQLKTELFENANRSNECFDEHLIQELNSPKEYILEDLDENCKNKTTPQPEEMSLLLNSNKSSPQRRKSLRTVTGAVKNPTVGRTLYPLKSTEERKYICGVCGFAFKDKYNYRCHLLRHSNQKRLTCFVWPKKLFTKAEMRLHENRHKGERPQLCNYCGMGFRSWTSLTQHLRKHSLYRSLKCEQCHKAFSSFEQLRNDLAGHNNEHSSIKASLSKRDTEKHLTENTSENYADKHAKDDILKKSTLEESNSFLKQNIADEN